MFSERSNVNLKLLFVLLNEQTRKLIYVFVSRNSTKILESLKIITMEIRLLIIQREFVNRYKTL